MQIVIKQQTHLLPEVVGITLTVKNGNFSLTLKIGY